MGVGLWRRLDLSAVRYDVIDRDADGCRPRNVAGLRAFRGAMGRELGRGLVVLGLVVACARPLRSSRGSARAGEHRRQGNGTSAGRAAWRVSR